MATQHHIIKRQVIDLKIDRRLSANDIQDRVSKIYKDTLIPILNQYLDTLSQTDSIDRINNLEIDLGAIRGEDLEFALVEKLEEQLYLANPKITSLPKQIPVLATDELLPITNQPDADIIVYFLQTGALPWWVKVDKYVAFENAVRHLLDKESATVTSFFGSLLQDDTSLRRLIYTADDDLINDIFIKIAPYYKATSFTLTQLYRYLGQGDNIKPIRELWWSVLLTNTLRLPASTGKTTVTLIALYFDKLKAQEIKLLREEVTPYSAFITFYKQAAVMLQTLLNTFDSTNFKQQKEYLKQIAQYLEKNIVISSKSELENLNNVQVIWNKLREIYSLPKVDYDKLTVTSLTGSADDGITSPNKSDLTSGTGKESLNINAPIKTQLPANESQNGPPVNDESHRQSNPNTETGAQSLIKSPVIDQRELSASVEATTSKNILSPQTDQALNTAAGNLQNEPLVNDESNRQSNPDTKTGVPSLIKSPVIDQQELSASAEEPTSKNMLSPQTDQASNMADGNTSFVSDELIDIQKDADDLNTNAVTKISGQNDLMQTQPIEPDDIQTPESNLPPYHKPQFSAASGKLVSSFSDTDRLYIPCSGLVLLWPFLERFFSSIGLIGESGFINGTASTKACLLLQYIAEGSQWQRFEPNMPLNKLFCGIDLFEPVDLNIEITENELAAADHLLEAVIANAPLWKSLTTDGLRTAYLQRDGILSSRDGNWLLQVQRQTYDILLDRLPWAIKVVKLPWMNNLIFVEWQQS